MSVTRKPRLDLPNGRHASIRNLNPDGVKLPPIPMSIELADALEVEANLSFRSPRDHAWMILEIHFGTKSSADLGPPKFAKTKRGLLKPACILPFPKPPQDAWDEALNESSTIPERRFVRRMKAMHVTTRAGMEILEALVFLENVEKDVLAEAMKLMVSVRSV